MTDSQLEQESLKAIAPTANLSDVVASTWQQNSAIQTDGPVPMRAKQDVSSDSLDCSNGNDLYLQSDGLPIRLAQADRTHVSDHITKSREIVIQKCDVSEEFADKVKASIDHLPPKVRQQLAASDLQVLAMRDIAAYDKQFKTHKAMEGVSPGKYAKTEAASLHDLGTSPPRIAIFEHTQQGEQVESYESVQRLTRHEAAHVLDRLNGFASLTDSKFGDLAEADRGAIPKDELSKLEKGSLNHYLQRNSLPELYAEFFAITHGGGSNQYEDRLLVKYFGNLADYMREKYSQ